MSLNLQRLALELVADFVVAAPVPATERCQSEARDIIAVTLAMKTSRQVAMLGRATRLAALAARAAAACWRERARLLAEEQRCPPALFWRQQAEEGDRQISLALRPPQVNKHVLLEMLSTVPELTPGTWVMAQTRELVQLVAQQRRAIARYVRVRPELADIAVPSSDEESDEEENVGEEP
jgi:hypothetical protein